MPFWRCLVVGLMLASAGCRTADDYMNDLETVDPVEGNNVFEKQAIVFDAGQLIHESLVGLGHEEGLELWMAMRALHKACVILGKAEKNALLRADAAVLIGHLCARVPVPPIDVPFEHFTGVEPLAFEQVAKLSKMSKPLQIRGAIGNLESPDEAQRQQALDVLRELSGEDFGPSKEPWDRWWEQARGEQEKAFVEETREPARILGGIKFANASQARSVLGILAFFVRQSDDPEFQAAFTPSVLRVARQAAVLQLAESIADPDYEVRCDVADSMARILDPAFGDPLIRQLQADRHPQSILRIIRTLRDYPGRKAIIAILTTMQQDDQRIRTACQDSLRDITGERFGTDPTLWVDWWTRIGDKRWL